MPNSVAEPLDSMWFIFAFVCTVGTSSIRGLPGGMFYGYPNQNVLLMDEGKSVTLI